MISAVEVRQLCKIYRKHNGRVILSVDHLSLSIPQGQVLGLLGPNGAGKTTTIKMICGLITPSSGEVLLDGKSIVKNRYAAMRQIGAVLEGTRNIYWRLSAWQNLLYFGRLKGCSDKAICLRAEPLLRELDLWERRFDPVGEFSRGMQQKVAIACALIADPSVVLFDEPTLGLDVQAARTIKDWVTKLAYEQGKTVIITSHELNMVQEICERVAILRQGQLVADRPMAELLDLFRQERYEIEVGKTLNSFDAEQFAGLTLDTCEEGTLLSGPIPDQETLHEILTKIHNLALPLVSVNRVEPDLEDIFLQLIAENRKEITHANSSTSYA